MGRLCNYLSEIIADDLSHNIADVVVEADGVDQSMFGAMKLPGRTSLLLSEDRASIDCSIWVKC